MKETADTKQIGGSHYLNYSIQPARYLQLNMITWNPGNVIKYICRYKKKGTPLQDLEKALHYTQLQSQLIDEEGLSGGKVIVFRIAPETFCLVNDLSKNQTEIIITMSRYPWDLEMLDDVAIMIEALIEGAKEDAKQTTQA